MSILSIHELCFRFVELIHCIVYFAEQLPICCSMYLQGQLRTGRRATVQHGVEASVSVVVNHELCELDVDHASSTRVASIYSTILLISPKDGRVSSSDCLQDIRSESELARQRCDWQHKRDGGDTRS